MIAPYAWGGDTPQGVHGKVQCLYVQNGISPPNPLLGGNKIPIGRENKSGSLLFVFVLCTSTFFSFLIYLFLKEEGGEGCKVNDSAILEIFQGGILEGVDRGVTWN